MKFWNLHIVLGLVLAFIASTRAWGVVLRPAAVGGLMQQPTSEYYHYVYGGQIDLSGQNDRALARAQFLERPEFRYGGYSDQDFSAMFMLGGNIFSYKNWGLTSFFGGGRAWGYIRDLETGETLSYAQPGLGVGLEARYSIPRFELRLAFQHLVCQDRKDQLDVFVAWPFSWFLVSLATPVTFGGRR